VDIAAFERELAMAESRRIVWLNVLTVISAAILIGAEVFGAAFAGSWAIATLFDLGGFGQRILDALFVLCGIAVMVQFIRNAHNIEPFTARG
jgi:ABC-type dipeptide/oligopeptide/nickel transport system permease component